MNLRILYGEWDFGPGTLLVGQTYSPLNMIYSSQVWWDDTGLLDFGGLYSGRNPMIRLKFGGFQTVLLEPAIPGISALTSTEAKLPKIEAKYRFSGQHGFLEIAGGYNSYKILNGNVSYDIDSYIDWEKNAAGVDQGEPFTTGQNGRSIFNAHTRVSPSRRLT